MVTSGRAVMLRAVPLASAMTIAGAIVFAGHGLRMCDVVALMHGSLAVRAVHLDRVARARDAGGGRGVGRARNAHAARAAPAARALRDAHRSRGERAGSADRSLRARREHARRARCRVPRRRDVRGGVESRRGRRSSRRRARSWRSMIATSRSSSRHCSRGSPFVARGVRRSNSAPRCASCGVRGPPSRSPRVRRAHDSFRARASSSRGAHHLRAVAARSRSRCETIPTRARSSARSSCSRFRSTIACGASRGAGDRDGSSLRALLPQRRLARSRWRSRSSLALAAPTTAFAGTASAAARSARTGPSSLPIASMALGYVHRDDDRHLGASCGGRAPVVDFSRRRHRDRVGLHLRGGVMLKHSKRHQVVRLAARARRRCRSTSPMASASSSSAKTDAENRRCSKLVTGVLDAFEGAISAPAAVGYAPEKPDMPDHLLAGEWLDLVASLKRSRWRDELDVRALLGRKIGALSLGQQSARLARGGVHAANRRCSCSTSRRTRWIATRARTSSPASQLDGARRHARSRVRRAHRDARRHDVGHLSMMSHALRAHRQRRAARRRDEPVHRSLLGWLRATA